jgi:hypothetical protein
MEDWNTLKIKRDITERPGTSFKMGRDVGTCLFHKVGHRLCRVSQRIRRLQDDPADTGIGPANLDVTDCSVDYC